MLSILWPAVLALAATGVAGQPVAPPPCSAPEYRQFDFWLGDWEVRGPRGKVAGTNRITPAYGGCVLHEQYDTGRAYSGASFSTYDVGQKKWHQTWVDTSGTLLRLDGGLIDGRMVLEGEATGADGARTRHRISWTANADGTVRQLWESTNPAGEWTISFDGKYTKLPTAK